MRRKWWISIGGIAVIAALAGTIFLRGFDWPGSPWAAGMPIEALNGVAVYDNGPIASVSHGRNAAPDGYYFGQKWQCVEFVKRYLYQARGHKMPDGMGDAASFFDPATPPGALNERRGLVQFRQGGPDAPIAGDLIVFDGAAGFGHVAIVAAAGEDFIEIVQQNAAPPRERMALKHSGNGYLVEGRLPALGWLRVPTMQAEHVRGAAPAG